MKKLVIKGKHESCTNILIIGFQVTKVDSYYSEILDIIFGVSQGSILGSLLFNINLVDLFLIGHYKSDFEIMQMTPPHIVLVIHFWRLYQTLMQQ